MKINDATAFGKVAVLMGGRSAEREISLKSGAAVLAALCAQGIDAHVLDPDERVLQRLQDGHFTRAFIALHGRGGEDGIIQGALETLGLPYTGSGVLGSALGIDKYRCKCVWQSLELPTPPAVLLRTLKDLERAAMELGFPVMVKPVHEGSSIGMSRANDERQLRIAWEQALQFDSQVLAERWIQGAEYTCALLGDEALPIIRLETPHIFYDYIAKYSADSTRYHCPSGLPDAVELRFRNLALAAFQAVGGYGWGRVDLLTDDKGEPWLLEVNTVPGMTDHSLVPMAARVAGLTFEALVWRILETSYRT